MSKIEEKNNVIQELLDKKFSKINALKGGNCVCAGEYKCGDVCDCCECACNDGYPGLC